MVRRNLGLPGKQEEAKGGEGTRLLAAHGLRGSENSLRFL